MPNDLDAAFTIPNNEPTQDAWFALCKQHGKVEARRLLAAKLRAFADCVEAGCVSSGDVYGMYIERPGEKPCTGDSALETLAVTLSTPWGG